MFDIKQSFDDNLAFDEFGEIDFIGIPIQKVPKSGTIENNDFSRFTSITLDAVLPVYQQVDFIIVHWEISKRDTAALETFQSDPWIKTNYLDKGFEWPVVHEMLSGFINIQKLEDLLNPEFCKEQGYYYKLKNTAGINPDDYLPFDLCSGMTACLKKVDGKIADNVWLVITEDVDDCLYDMQLSIEEYLNLAYQAKIFHHWQAIYLWKEKYDKYELMKRFLPKMLPHVTLDLSAFGIN